MSTLKQPRTVSYIGSHDNDSLLGMTLVVSGARMLMQLVLNDLPTGNKAEIRSR